MPNTDKNLSILGLHITFPELCEYLLKVIYILQKLHKLTIVKALTNAVNHSGLLFFSEVSKKFVAFLLILNLDESCSKNGEGIGCETSNDDLSFVLLCRPIIMTL